ncbi:MAG: response regulator transcription factor [Saprospiraceae bacterium]|nr:response regulator transcription factor [Saprospiraceae bacterium]MBK9680621.1 response regulator transcription factor [Saprospiraceae bacterium]
MTSRIFIVDDEPKSRSTLRSLILTHCPEVEIAGEAGSVHEAQFLLERIKVDMIFLDVALQDGTGFDLLDRLSSIHFNVIFTTAYDEFAVKAFRYNAIDYLLKPINPDELKAAFHKGTLSLNHKIVETQIANLITTTAEQNFDRITLPTSEGLVFALTQDIARLESYGNYSFVYFKNGERILASQNLKLFEEILPHNIFFRIHQSYIINTIFLKKTIKNEGDFVLMQDATKIPIARRRKDEFFKFMNDSVKNSSS